MILIEQISYNCDQGISAVLGIRYRHSQQISYTQSAKIFRPKLKGAKNDAPGRNH